MTGTVQFTDDNHNAKLHTVTRSVNPFNASCSKSLLLEECTSILKGRNEKKQRCELQYRMFANVKCTATVVHCELAYVISVERGDDRR